MATGSDLIKKAAPHVGEDYHLGHIVFSNGGGGTIEAHSSRTGVIRSTLSSRRWDVGVLVPGIEYTQAAGAVVVGAPVLTLRLAVPLMRGGIVRSAQRALKAKGFNPGPIDGLYGLKTVAAANAFQIVNGLVPDGEVWPSRASVVRINCLANDRINNGHHALLDKYAQLSVGALTAKAVATLIKRES